MLRLIVIAVMLFLAAFWGVALKTMAIQGQFDQIKLHASEIEVREIMGDSYYIRPCGDYLTWGNDGRFIKNDKHVCVKEWRYDFFLNGWGIGFDENSLAVSKYHYQMD